MKYKNRIKKLTIFNQLDYVSLLKSPLIRLCVVPTAYGPGSFDLGMPTVYVA